MIRLIQRVRLLPVVALSVLLGLAGCGGDPTVIDESSLPPSLAIPAPTEDIPADPIIIEVMVAGGVVTPAGSEVRVPVGSTVRLLIASDMKDEAHVHGYELTLELATGTLAELEFVADIPGIFDVESHESGQLLCLLRVE